MKEPVARRVRDFCAAYGVGETTAYKLGKEGKIEMVRLGARHTVVLEASAKRWLASLTPVRTPVAASEKRRRRAKDGEE